MNCCNKMGGTALDGIRLGVSLLLLLYVAKKIWNVFYVFLIGPRINKVDIKSYGKWALVTGCTDGIGKEYARQLAARGCDIILVSRSLEKLKAVAEEIENDFKVKTKAVQIDFGGDVSIYDKIAREIEGMEIGTLVNNVGVAYPYPEYFLELSDWKKVITNMINVNILSMIRMTGMILPEMTKRGKGIIINIGSISDRLFFPMRTIYAATKAFVTKFSEGIEHEYSNQGILVQCVIPGFVKSNMFASEKTNFFVRSPDDYVQKALSLLGTTTLTCGCFAHALLLWILSGINEYISEKFIIWLSIKVLEFVRKLHKEKCNKI